MPNLVTNWNALPDLLLIISLVVHNLLVCDPVLVAMVLDLVEGCSDGMEKPGKPLELTNNER